MELSEEWWQKLCNEVQVNPVLATNLISDFRSNPAAFEASSTYIVSQKLSADAKFHALSIYQFNLVTKKWSTISLAEKIAYFESFIWPMFIQELRNGSSGVSPEYLVAKYMQTVAIFVKRIWKELSTQEHRNFFFQKIALIFDEKVLVKYGIKLLRMILQEFSFRSTVEIGLPLNFHIQARKLFTAHGLSSVAELAFRSMGSSFADITHALSNGILNADTIHFLSSGDEACQLYSDVISWFTTGQDDVFSSERSGGLAFIQLPPDCVKYLLTPEMLTEIMTLYGNIRGSLASYLKTKDILSSCERFLLAVRQLIMNISFVYYAFGADKERDILYKCHILSLCMPIFESTVKGEAFFENLRDFRSQECEGFSQIANRIFSIVDQSDLMKYSALEQGLLTCCQAAASIGNEIALFAKVQLLEELNKKKEAYDILSTTLKYLDHNEDNSWHLLDNWRGSCLSSLLEIIALFITALQSPELDDANLLENRVYCGLSALCPNLYTKLYDCVSMFVVVDSLMSCDEEEDDEEEQLISLNLDTFMREIARIGSINFTMAGNHTASVVEEVVAQIRSNTSTNALETLEKIRVALIMASHLISSNFTTETVKKSRSSEKSIMSTFFLFSFTLNPSEVKSALFRLLQSVMSFADLEAQLLQSKASESSHLASPLILKVLIDFFSEYTVVFRSIDMDSYSSRYAEQCRYLASIHGSEYDSVLFLVLSMCQRVLQSLPMEKDLIHSVAKFIHSLAEMPTDNVAPIAAHPLMCKMFFVVIDSSAVYKVDMIPEHSLTLQACAAATPDRVSALSGDCIPAMISAICTLFIVGQAQQSYLQICEIIFANFQSIAAQSITGNTPVVAFENNISYLRGLCTCDYDFSDEALKVLHQLFDKCFPFVQTILSALNNSHDSALKTSVLLLLDYAETQIMTLPTQSTMILFTVSQLVLEMVRNRLTTELRSALLDETQMSNEVSFRNEMISSFLQLLQQLSSKDYVLFDIDTTSNGANFETLVVDVLFHGLNVFVPLMSADLLRSFPSLCEKYFNFVNSSFAMYMSQFAAKIVSMPKGLDFLRSLCQHLLWASGGVDTACAALALNTIRDIASFQFHGVIENRPHFPMEIYGEVFSTMLEQLLQMLIFPGQADCGISWECIGKCSGALFFLIGLYYQHFEAFGQRLIAQQPSELHADLINCFRKLLLDRDINYKNSKNRATTLAFAENVEEFVEVIRPLVTYK